MFTITIYYNITTEEVNEKFYGGTLKQMLLSKAQQTECKTIELDNDETIQRVSEFIDHHRKLYSQIGINTKYSVYVHYYGYYLLDEFNIKSSMDTDYNIFDY